MLFFYGDDDDDLVIEMKIKKHDLFWVVKEYDLFFLLCFVRIQMLPRSLGPFCEGDGELGLYNEIGKRNSAYDECHGEMVVDDVETQITLNITF